LVSDECTLEFYLNILSRGWAMSFNHFLRHKPNTTVPDFRRLHKQTAVLGSVASASGVMEVNC